MALALGIDVGSTTVKVVAVDDRARLRWAASARHAGRPFELVATLKRAAQEVIGETRVGYTGTLGTMLAEAARATAVHEVHAVTLAVRVRAPHARTIVELGGQDAKVIWLDRDSARSEMNDRCAAGTGATLDRIARRLALTEAEVRAAAPRNDLRVTARCGVFAENDAVNLVQLGAGRSDVFGAVARGVVAQCLSALMKGRLPEAPVVLLGGPHVHVPALATAWADALRGVWSRELEGDDVTVPAAAHLFGAIGAALHVLRGGGSLVVARGVTSGERRVPPLVESEADAEEIRALLETLHGPARPKAGRASKRSVHVGVDAGTTTCKAVAVDAEGRLVASSYVASTGDPVLDARAALDQLGAAARQVATLGVTGYGAALVAKALGASATIVETDAHARGARAVAPDTDVVVDVGGTDVKVLRLRPDGVGTFYVSSQCAAGHGAFVAATAAELGVPVDEIAERAFSATRAPRFAIGCAVFMDTDRVSFQRDGYTPAEILAGLSTAVARSVWEHVVGVPPARLGQRFLLTGGAHRNLAIAWAQVRHLRERVPGVEVRLAPQPELVGALGAALVAREPRTGAAPLAWHPGARVEVLRTVAPHCAGCELGCERTLVEVRRDESVESLVLGAACERGATVGTLGRRSARHAADLFDDEARRLFRPGLAPPPGPLAPRTPVLMFPRVMGLYRCAPLLQGYLRAAGLPESHVRFGPPTSPALLDASRVRAANDPCFPAKSVAAHVDAALRAHSTAPFDVLVLPAVTHAHVEAGGTADDASCPLVTASGHTALVAVRRHVDRLAECGVSVLQPELCLSVPARLGEQLFESFGPVLGLDRARHEVAFAHALLSVRAYREGAARRGGIVLERARREGRTVAVILARPYLSDPGFTHGISMELAARGIPVLSVLSLPATDRALTDLSDLAPTLTNSGSAEKLWAARVIARDPALVAVDVSSFRCGQDASILGTLTDLLDAADKPWLALHDLDEQRPAATLRMRIETFAAAVRRYEERALSKAPP